MTGKERLAVDLAKARLNAAMNGAMKEMYSGHSDERERERVVEEAPQHIESGRKFTIRSGVR